MPLTDQEIGSAPLNGGQYLPWDGVRGPRATTFEGKPVAAYLTAFRTDYIDLIGTMTAALTSRIDLAEHQARILAMEAVYWALGIHDPDFVRKYGEKEAVYRVLFAKAGWAVLSFRSVPSDDHDLAAAESEAGAKLDGQRRYAFQVFRWGKEMPDPGDLRIVYVEMLEQAFAYVSDATVLFKLGDAPWKTDRSMPT